MSQNFVGDVMDKNYDVKTFISKYAYYKKAEKSQFCKDHQNCNYVY